MKFCLVVDDSDVIRKVARKILEGAGYIVIEAETASEGLERCRAAMPDIILLDSILPDCNSRDFLDSLREINAERIPQVLYCTSDADPAEIGKLFRAGINAFVHKPFEPTTLLPKVRELQGTADAFA